MLLPAMFSWLTKGLKKAKAKKVKKEERKND